MNEQDAIRRAEALAAEAHAGQVYGSEPYTVHLRAVVNVIKTFDLAETYMVAGWLHDVAEDTPITIQELREQFGQRVASLVNAVTAHGASREEHAASIVEQLRGCPSACPLKLADRIANVEAARRGDRHSARYIAEHGSFEAVVKPHVPPPMWERYIAALAAVKS